MSTVQPHDIAGAIGVAMIIVAYLLLQIDRLDSSALSYSVVNGLGAALILFSLWYEFNLAAFLVEFFWLLISVVGIVRYLQRRRSGDAAQ